MCPSDPRGSSLPSPSSSNGAWCPEFYPTRSEFQSFATYIRTVVEPQCADIGICKIIPPRGWFSRSYDISQLDCQVSAPVSQHVAGKKGIFNVDLVERKTMSPLEFQMMTEAATDKEPEGIDDPMEVERRFWKGLRGTMDAPVYGADIVASLFGDADALSWNLGNLNSILRKIDLPGVTRPMLYFGMWRAMFAFHTEDMDLFSINYVHTGKPKFWYGIPPDAAPQLERAAQSMFPEKHHTCSQFLRHKTSLISPARLREFGVPFYRAYQKPGEFVITFPAAYHQGFNLGFNIAEAVNFASLHWIPYGLKAKVCKCLPDSVRIDMNSFLTKLFSGPPSGPELLGDDPWVFSCKCHKYCSSNNPNFKVEEQWFECSKCKIWAHVRCVHPDFADTTSENLPQSLLCHRCISEPVNDEPRTLSSGGVGRRSGTAAKSAVRGSLGKRKKEVVVKSKSKAKATKASPISSVRSPAQKAKRAPRITVPSAITPKRATKSVAPSTRKYLSMKGSTIKFEDTEAKVAAVEGKYIRVHYKGESVDNDEWLPRPGKDVSVGEYDPKTGLTHITQQRGRMLFNMGASSKRQRRAPPDASGKPTKVWSKPKPLPTSTGTFTGLSLYPEEAFYLLQRGALAVYLMQSADGGGCKDAKLLDIADFSALLAASVSVSFACLDVYGFLKDQKLHPRRCLEPTPTISNSDLDVITAGSEGDGRCPPRHFVEGQPCDVAFDVWKTMMVYEEPPAIDGAVKVSIEYGDGEQISTAVVAKPRKPKKKLAIAFRVIVCRFGDAAPRPRSFREAVERSKARDRDGIGAATPNISDGHTAARKDDIPIKVAVVHHDRSILLYEININITNPLTIDGNTS